MSHGPGVGFGKKNCRSQSRPNSGRLQNLARTLVTFRVHLPQIVENYPYDRRMDNSNILKKVWLINSRMAYEN